MLQSILTEFDQRKNYLEKEKINTIYFGGGTPSFVSSDFIDAILQKIAGLFSISDKREITIECNPDDITAQRLKDYQKSGVNRFSMGVQSFDDEVLKWMNRAHTSHEIFTAINLAREYGFSNLTIDLIYGIPGKNLEYWKKQLDLFIQLDIRHLSSYCLTIEPKTVFGAQQKHGNLITPDDEESLAQFQYLIDFTKKRGYEQYEISNFAKPGFLSKHNSNYWLGEKYLGIGPSAHSYNGIERSWNVRNNNEYIKLINSGSEYSETEILSISNRCNDYLLTRLRTKWGIKTEDLDFIKEEDLNQIIQKLELFKKLQLITFESGKYLLTDTGKYRADGIASELFI